jgi:hypothetical protein
MGTTSDNRDQTDEDILTYRVSDEALETAAAPGNERLPNPPTIAPFSYCEYHCG